MFYLIFTIGQQWSSDNICFSCFVSTSNIWRELGAESLLFHVQMRQLMWFGHLIRMPPGHTQLAGEPEHKQTQDMLERAYLIWECLGFPREVLESVAGMKGENGWMDAS